MGDLSDWRNRIDEIDEQLLELFNKRAEHAIQIGRFKSQYNLPVYDPERETAIINHLCAINKGPLSNEAVKRLFLFMFKESKRLENEES